VIYLAQAQFAFLKRACTPSLNALQSKNAQCSATTPALFFNQSVQIRSTFTSQKTQIVPAQGIVNVRLIFVALRGWEGDNKRSFIIVGRVMPHREVSLSSVAELGAFLRAVRKESGLTQRDAAALCNVSLPFLNGVEQGKPTAQIGKVLAVCSRLGIEVRLRLPDEVL